MKHDIVLVPFPFDNLKTSKVRPAICLTSEVGHYDHLVIAFITSRMDLSKEASDLIVLEESEAFKMTGLKTSSVIRLHRLVTVPRKLIRRKLGRLPDALKSELDLKLKELFDL
ncbi:MAG: type II toxin-antitoxin system PemK/MazF family toxin [Bacteroidetes bacterium]|jgi:mRNA interferase MazF|nr:type II toxin-antitoxin system PemK/MazF family toxin [Bacteroidota bacterium]